MFGFFIFSIGSAVGKDLQKGLTCRVFGGVLGSCPLAVVAAVSSDNPNVGTLGLGVTVFSMTVFTRYLHFGDDSSYVVRKSNRKACFREQIDLSYSQDLS